MRSEEMHRCAEYEGLSEVIFASSVQVELLTNTEDLRSVIIGPTRRAFDSWGIPYNRSTADTSPFAPDLVEFLVREAQLLSGTLVHKPDGLPLLQHALREVWNSAVTRWGEWLVKPTAEWRPEITKSDFRWHGHSSPFRACLNECADAVRTKALAKVAAELGGDAASTETAAAYLTDMAFVSLARMDDNNRWVRNFGSATQIAEASIVEVTDENSKLRSTRSLLRSTLPRRQFTEILNKEMKEKAVAAALEAFRRAGYLVRNGAVYDVSHEALIRSWKYYQDLLKQAALTRDALHKADKVMTDLASMPGPNLGTRLLNWWKGGRSRQAWEAFKGINIADLGKLFVKPRWLGKNWAEAQLDASAQAAPEQPPTPASVRLARIERTLLLAKRWKEWDGLKPPRELRRFLTVSFMPLPLVIGAALLYLTFEAERQLRVMLLYSAALSDGVIQNDPVEARKQLTSALAAGTNIVTRHWIYDIPGYMFSRGPVEETSFQILDQNARTVFRYLPGRVAKGLIPEENLSSVDCAKADRSPSPILSISGLPLKYYEELKGFSFFPPRPDQGFSQSMPFEQGDVICAPKSNGGLLMRIQSASVIVYPLTVIAKSSDAKTIQIGAPTPVSFYDADLNNTGLVFNQKVAGHIALNALNGGIKYFEGREQPHKNVQAFVIPYEGKSIYIANIAGAAYQPHVMERKECALYFKDRCSLSELPSTFVTRSFDGLRIDNRLYVLDVGIASPCMTNDEFCPQQLVLRRPGAAKLPGQVGASLETNGQAGAQSPPKAPLTSRMDFIYVGFPIVDAVADDGGHIILLDAAGNVLEFMVGINAFSYSLVHAGRFFFSPESEI
jgi:hypothetical protein